MRPLSEIAADLERLAQELREPPSVYVGAGEDLQAALTAAPSGSTVVLAGGAFVGNYTISKPLTVRSTLGQLLSPNGSPALMIPGNDVSVSGISIGSIDGATTNDLVVLAGERIGLADMTVLGNGATKRGIAANGRNMVIERTKVLRIGRIGQESQAVAIWDGTSLVMRDCVLEAGSTPFLSGGASPSTPDHVPSDILLDNCLLTHPMEWRGQGYVNKTGFEAKSGRNITVTSCIIENVWVDGQTGFAITLTPSQYGNSPNTTVEAVRFVGNTIRNVGGGANLLGFTQHADRPTLRGNGYLFVGNDFTISRATYGGHGALTQIGIEPSDVVWRDNTVTMDGAAMIRTSDARPIAGFAFANNVVHSVGTYGIWTPIGSRGGPWVQTVFPGIELSGNTFAGAHSIFKAQFPDNAWV